MVSVGARLCGNEQRTVEHARQALETLGKQRLIEVMDFMNTVLRPDPGYRLPVPTLLLCGNDDVSGNIRAATPRLAVRNPGARLRIIANAAHNPTMDRPDVTNRYLLDFLDELPPHLSP